MARAECKFLDTGDAFPHMEFSSLDGGTIVLPKDFGERWNVLVLYRGNW